MTQAVQKGRIGTNLTEGPIMNKLLIFAFPIVLTNLVQQLYSMVDLIIIGQFVGNIGTVGVNTGGEMADLVTPVAMGFSTAGQIFIAQLFGAKEDKKDGGNTAELYVDTVSCVINGCSFLPYKCIEAVELSSGSYGAGGKLYDDYGHRLSIYLWI